ncbi:REVERSE TRANSCRIPTASE ZINC-BINDING DOMAIN-CONTAINING PROTEIN-RELATED-RELATED [Salix viminalis]|uniref:REVERSE TRANSCRIPTASE ZINC-BINDING DOMAIN-CONTAINING PROTEIN-RELATED-RELATED n=1 Tax=Salix viminalis TaxID=40686 RepID=A0A9Q0Z3E0_SALVM|nr:REVERSE TRANSCRIPTASE ZINC-BINDING DOMAIN-CONTAINING PROTEIN-RELATED-RELATED [Salix viminalis]
MEGWEAKVLSSSGRITILKSILTSMPLYLLHVIVPPKSVMCRIERLFNKFLWSSKGQKRIHWECWEDFCYPIEEGGLGMRRLQDLVNAMSLKLWWRFRTVNNLWSNFMKCKYGYNNVSFSGGASFHDSSIWKRLSKVGRACDNLIRWKVGCELTILSSRSLQMVVLLCIVLRIGIQSKDICMVSKCYGCNDIESLEHLFLLCPSVSPVWNFFAAMFSVSLPVDGSIRHWLSACFFSGDYVSAGFVGNVRRRFSNFSKLGLLKRRNWKGDMKLASFFGCHYVLDQEYSPKIVRWIKPKEHCFKLNVDGSFQGNSVVVGGGGILRDWHGNVSFFFFLPLKAKSALHAEILTLYHGLNICKDRGIGRVWIEMDALSVINLVQNRCIGSCGGLL